MLRCKVLQDEPGFLIKKSKISYFSKITQKLSDKTTNSEAHWSMLKTFLSYKKIHTDAREKAELFNTFFCWTIFLSKTDSKLPKNVLFLPRKFFSNVHISNENMIMIINNLDSSKTYGHDMISSRKSKLCRIYLCKHLSITFNWIKNCRPVSLLPMCCKIFRRILLIELYKFFMKMTCYNPTRLVCDLVTHA